MQTCSACYLQFPEGLEKCSFCGADALTVLQAPPPPRAEKQPYTQHGSYPPQQSGFNYPAGYPPQPSGFNHPIQGQMPMQQPVPQRKSRTWLWITLAVLVTVVVLSGVTCGGLAFIGNAELEKEATATAQAQKSLQLTQTAVAQATATAEAYGALLVNDPLTDKSASQFISGNSTDGTGQCLFRSDGYHVKETAKRPFTCTSQRKFQDFTTSVNVKLISNGCAGFTFRDTGQKLNAYVTMYCSNGDHWLDVLENGKRIRVLYEKRGTPVGNSFTLGLYIKGPSLSFYVNSINTPVYTVTDATYQDIGWFGLAVFNNQSNGTEAVFSDLVVREAN